MYTLGQAARAVGRSKTTLGRSSYTLDVQLVNQVNPGPVTKLTSPPLPRETVVGVNVAAADDHERSPPTPH